MAAAEIRVSGLRWEEAELLRVSGEARLLGPSADPDRAGRDLEAAGSTAECIGAHITALMVPITAAIIIRTMLTAVRIITVDTIATET